MSAIKPVIRELRQAVLDGMAHAKDKLHQLGDNLSEHFDTVVRQVRGTDKYEPKHKSPVQRDWRGRWRIDENAQRDLIDRKRDGEELPNPDLMLPQRYRDEHLSLFDNGGARIQSKGSDGSDGSSPWGYEGHGPFRDDGDHTTFLMPTEHVQNVIANADGDVSKIESQLGLNPGDLTPPLVIVEFPTLTSSDVRMPSGNETGANDSWIPFGHLPTGIPEGVHEKNGLPHFGTDIPLR